VRFRYVAAALLTIVVGLGVHLGGSFIPPAARDVAGDALWATMMLWWISAVSPRSRLVTRAGIALGISWLVELSQLYHAPWLDAARSVTLGRLVLGTGFDTRDLVAYAGGVALGCLIDGLIRGRPNPPQSDFSKWPAPSAKSSPGEDP
jgi:hypothetical protein